MSTIVRMRRWRGWHEVVPCLVVATVAFATGRVAYQHVPEVPHFYQAAFGPAVMVAAGRGFVNPEPVPGGALEQFLGRRVDELALDDLGVARVLEPDQFQHAHRYLLTAVGYWWRMAGIAWHELAQVAGGLHALAAVSVYALLRLVVPVGASLVGSLWFTTTPLQLAYVPHFRDYAKGAFVLATLPLIAALALRVRPGLPLATAAAATGLLVGVGFGVRLDVGVMLPIALVVLWLFRAERPWHDARGKLGATAVMVAAFLAVAAPILSRLSAGGSNVSHVILLGAGEWFDAGLRIEAAPYRLFPYYSDVFMEQVVRAHAEPWLGHPVRMPSPEYERGGMALLRDLAATLPGDVLTRTLGSVNGVLNLAFADRAFIDEARALPLQTRLAPIYAWLERAQGWGAWLGLGFVVAASGVSLRLGGLAAALIFLLAGYPVLQFDPRHYFHLQALPIAMIVFAVWGVISVISMARSRALLAGVGPPGGWRRAAIRAGIGAAALGIVVVVPVTLLRARQTWVVTAAIDDTIRAKGQALPIAVEPLDDRRWLVTWPEVSGRWNADGDLAFAYYLVEFRADDDWATIAAAVRHSPPIGQCPRLLVAAGGAGTTYFGFPVYSARDGSVFEGLELGAETMRRFGAVYRLEHGPAGLPLEWRLPPEWRARRLFQALTFERYPAEPAVRVAASAVTCDALLRYADAQQDAVFKVSEGLIAHAWAGARVTPEGLGVHGPPATSFVAELIPVTLAAGDALVATVSVRRGAATVGLLQEGRWRHYANADRPGDVVLAVPVVEPGVYVPMVAHADPSVAEADFLVRRIGVVRPDGTPAGLLAVAAPHRATGGRPGW